MPAVSRVADLYYTYRFIKVLTTPWKNTEAYELGLIDDNGKSLRKAKTSEEKDAYTVFFRLAFNFKRILEKLPFGKSRLSSYAAALFLLREETGMSEEEIKDILSKMEIDFTPEVKENFFILEEQLLPGVYILHRDILSPKTAEAIAKTGTNVSVAEGTKPAGHILDIPIYEVRHLATKQMVYVTAGDLYR